MKNNETLEQLKTRLLLHVSDAKSAEREGKSPALHLEFADGVRGEIAARLGCRASDVSCYIEQRPTQHVVA